MRQQLTKANILDGRIPRRKLRHVANEKNSSKKKERERERKELLKSLFDALPNNDNPARKEIDDK
jgi:hypothetical protein